MLPQSSVHETMYEDKKVNIYIALAGEEKQKSAIPNGRIPSAFMKIHRTMRLDMMTTSSTTTMK